MQVSPYLNFNRRCAEAFRFYQQTLGGSLTAMQTFGETPAKDHVPPDWYGRIVHACLELDGEKIMGSDAPPPNFAPAQGLYVAISVTQQNAKRTFDAFAEGGRVTMPFGPTFWSSGFGMVVDRFGTPWMVDALS